MSARVTVVLMIFVGLAAPAVLTARQNIVKNGSMEYGPGPLSEDPRIPAHWIRFGPTVERSEEANLVPPGAGHALKAFSSDPQVGAYQDVPVSPGASVQISASCYTRSSDPLAGDAQVWIILEFYKANNQLAGFHPCLVLDASSPKDTWVPASVGPIVAPAGTAYARMTCAWTWAGNASGSAYWDDCKLTVDGGANQILNGDFETAGVGQQSPFGIDDWIGFNDQEKSNDVALHGVASLKLGVGAAYSGLFQNMRVLEDGDHLYMIAYVWNPSGDPLTDNSRVGIKLEFSPAGGPAPPPEENLAFDETVPVNTWTLVDLNTTVPPDVSIARIVCIYTGDAQTTGAVHFDAAWAERGSAPGVNQLRNASFEQGPGGANGITNWTEFASPGVSQCRKSCFEVPAYDGYCTARATGQAVAGLWQEIAVTPGESLSIHAYLYTPDFQALAGPGRAGVKVEWRLGSVPPPVDIGGPTNTVYPGAPTDTWIPVTIDYVMPPDSYAATRFVNIIERASALSGTVYFDACEAVVLNRFDGCDWDGDDDQDLVDFAQMQESFTGPGGPMKWGGIVFDSDDDHDVDMDDFDYFAPRMTGPHP